MMNEVIEEEDKPQKVTLNHDSMILGISADQMRGLGTYTIKDGQVLDFVPLGMPIDAPQSASERSQEIQSIAPQEQTQEQTQEVPSVVQSDMNGG